MNEFEMLLISVIFMLYVTVFMDAFSVFMVMRGSVDADDYGRDVLKWPKIILFFIFGVVMLYYAFTVPSSKLMLTAEFVLGILLIADGMYGAIFKIKHGKKK